MNEKKRLLKNTGIIAIGNLSTKLVSFLLLPLYTAMLSTSEYGTVDYVISISTFCVPFISFLMDESMFRFLIDCKTDKEKAKIISNALILILIGGGLFILAAIPILYIVEYRYSIQLILYILTSVLTTMMCALLRGIGRTDKYAVFNFLLSSMKIVLNIVFIAVFHWGVEGMLFAAIISQVSLPCIYAFRIKLWRFIKLDSFEHTAVKQMLKYSIPLIPNKISWSIINLSDRIIIMNFLGSSSSGLYAVSYKFPTMMDTVYGFFYQSWKESSARIVNSDSKNEFYNMVYIYLKNFMYAVVIIMIAFMPVAFDLLVNQSYQEAILYVPALLISTYFSNMSGFYGGIFTAYKDTKIMGTTTVVAAVINLGINVALITIFGLYAAAISTLVANIIVYIYRKYKVRKYIQLVDDRIKQIKSIVVLVLINICYYSENTYMLIGGGILAVSYSVYLNKDVIMLLGSQMRKRTVV